MTEPRHALFPARVTTPAGVTHHPVRVATDTAGTTHAWAWNHDTGTPVEIGAWLADELVRADGRDHGRPVALQAPDGTLIDGRNAGCGCGHPLKAWRPALVVPAAG